MLFFGHVVLYTYVGQAWFSRGGDGFDFLILSNMIWDSIKHENYQLVTWYTLQQTDILMENQPFLMVFAGKLYIWGCSVTNCYLDVPGSSVKVRISGL